MIILYKIMKYSVEFFRFVFLIVAIPFIIPTMAATELFDTIEWYFDSKIKDLKNGKCT